MTAVLSGMMPYRSNGGSATFGVDPNFGTITGSAIQNNDWMIVIFMCSASSGFNIPSPPTSDWVNITPLGAVGSGTMIFGVWAKKRLSGETVYMWNQTTGGGTTNHRIIWVTGGADISTWAVGSFVTREVNATNLTTVAPTVNTPGIDTLAVCVAGERTLASETDPQITVSNFTKVYFENSTGDTTMTVATRLFSTTGPTGSVTITYPNVHSYNGIAGIIAIPSQDKLNNLPVNFLRG